MSDTKYKSLMRLIDVAIPHFDEDDGAGARTSSAQRPPTAQRHASAAFKIPSGFFGAASDEYAIDTDDEDGQSVTTRPERKAQPGSDDADDEFFEADPSAATVRPSSFHLVHARFDRLLMPHTPAEPRAPSACGRDRLQGRHAPGLAVQVRARRGGKASWRCRVPGLRAHICNGEVRHEGRREPEVRR